MLKIGKYTKEQTLVRISNQKPILILYSCIHTTIFPETADQYTIRKNIHYSPVQNRIYLHKAVYVPPDGFGSTPQLLRMICGPDPVYNPDIVHPLYSKGSERWVIELDGKYPKYYRTLFMIRFTVLAGGDSS